jgi:hypothetical protein
VRQAVVQVEPLFERIRILSRRKGAAEGEIAANDAKNARPRPWPHAVVRFSGRFQF